MRQLFNDDSLAGIWSRFKSGDQEAFAILYNHHVDNLYSYGTKLCNDEDAVKDSLQELFLELFMKRDKIKISPENLKFYLTLALKRSLIKKLHSGRKVVHGFNENVDFEPQYSIEFQIIEQEKDAEINRKVLNALNQLPAKQKEAMYLRFNEALEYGEIASILEITVESVRKQVHRALKTVREIIGKEPRTFMFAIFSKSR
ncbi:MAG: sigma-70 family RNA polymerase sigma factor [Mariniphaga sp.]